MGRASFAQIMLRAPRLATLAKSTEAKGVYATFRLGRQRVGEPGNARVFFRLKRDTYLLTNPKLPLFALCSSLE